MRYLNVLVIFLLLLLLGKGWYKATDGYKTAKIIPSIEIFQRWEKENKEEVEPLVRDILSQPFTYLGRGQQCYAFESSDQKYVIKIVRLHKYRIPFWCSLYPKKEIVEHRKKSWQRTLDSFSLAFTYLKKESALVYLHDKKTKRLPMLTLYDKLGRKSEVDSNHLVFVLQKKVRPIQAEADKWNAEETSQFIDQYLVTLTDRIEKNIRNKNRNILKNLGILEGQVVEFDVGEFRTFPTAESQESRKIEIIKSTRKLRKWLLKHHPSLVAHLDRKIEESVM